MLPAQHLVIRVVRGLALATAVDHSLAPATLLELYLASRLVKLVDLAGGVGAADELPGQLHVHPVVERYSRLWHAHTLIEAVFYEEVDERALAYRLKVVYV